MMIVKARYKLKELTEYKKNKTVNILNLWIYKFMIVAMSFQILINLFSGVVIIIANTSID